MSGENPRKIAGEPELMQNTVEDATMDSRTSLEEGDQPEGDEGSSMEANSQSPSAACQDGLPAPQNQENHQVDQLDSPKLQCHLKEDGEPTAELEEEVMEEGEGDAEDEEESGTDSDASSSSGEYSWRPISGDIGLVNQLLGAGTGPRDILAQLFPHVKPSEDDSDDMLWNLIVQVLTEPPQREKLPDFNTYEDAIELITKSKKILVLTGAGISVSCGIPDFRSKNGIYARLHVDFPDLPNPQAMFDIEFFKKNPLPFYDFAKEIYPGKFEPSVSHKFIALLEKQGKLLRNYTQNIDTLEQVAEITRVIQCHGSFATASCCSCKYKVDCDAIREDIECSRIPKCPKCPPETEFPVMKPDIVFFGESLPKEFHDQLALDKSEVDLLIVIGSSLKVRPVALIPNSIPENIPQILINNEPLKHLNFDIELLGSCDEIIQDICLRLGEPWSELSKSLRQEPLVEIELDVPEHQNSDLPHEISESSQEGSISATEEPEDDAEEPPLKKARDAEEDERGPVVDEDQKSPTNSNVPPSTLNIREQDAVDDDQSANDPAEVETPEGEGPIVELPPDHVPKRFIPPPLPDGSYYLIKPNRSFFPGAKIFSESEERRMSCEIVDVSDDNNSPGEGNAADQRVEGGNEVSDSVVEVPQ